MAGFGFIYSAYLLLVVLEIWFVFRKDFVARARDWLTYDLPSELIGVAWGGRYRGQTQMWFAARFEGKDSEIDLGPHDEHEQEFDAWRWVTLKELPARTLRLPCACGTRLRRG